jgi:hypothetical protein
MKSVLPKPSLRYRRLPSSRRAGWRGGRSLRRPDLTPMNGGVNERGRGAADRRGLQRKAPKTPPSYDLRACCGWSRREGDPPSRGTLWRTGAGHSPRSVKRRRKTSRRGFWLWGGEVFAQGVDGGDGVGVALGELVQGLVGLGEFPLACEEAGEFAKGFGVGGAQA